MLPKTKKQSVQSLGTNTELRILFIQNIIYFQIIYLFYIQKNYLFIQNKIFRVMTTWSLKANSKQMFYFEQKILIKLFHYLPSFLFFKLNLYLFFKWDWKIFTMVIYIWVSFCRLFLDNFWSLFKDSGSLESS